MNRCLSEFSCQPRERRIDFFDDTSAGADRNRRSQLITPFLQVDVAGQRPDRIRGRRRGPVVVLLHGAPLTSLGFVRCDRRVAQPPRRVRIRCVACELLRVRPRFLPCPRPARLLRLPQRFECLILSRRTRAMVSAHPDERDARGSDEHRLCVHRRCRRRSCRRSRPRCSPRTSNDRRWRPVRRLLRRVRNLPGPVVGAHKVAAFVAAATPQGAVESSVRECELNGQPAVVVLRDGRPTPPS